MRKLLQWILLATLISSSLLTPVQAQLECQGWGRYRVAKDGFSIELPELPSVISRGQYRQAPVRGARNYAAYCDGVVYFVIAFDNPKREKPLEYFLEQQLQVFELRNAEIAPGSEISNGSFKGIQHSLTKYDYRKTFSYPGIVRLYDTKDRVLALMAIGKDEHDASVGRFLQSFEISEKPNGKDIGTGMTYADAAPNADAPLMPNEVNRKVMVLIKPEPQYTEDARRQRLRGGVILRGVLSAAGRVNNLQVVSGLPGLTPSALEAAHKMYFIPAMKDGRFVSTFVELQYNFDIY